MHHSTLKKAYFLISMYNSIVHDHLCDTWLPTFETLSFFAYYFKKKKKKKREQINLLEGFLWAGGKDSDKISKKLNRFSGNFHFVNFKIF